MSACPTCGGTLDDLRDSGLLGCPDCYRHFRDALAPVLARFHGGDAHVGQLARSRDESELQRRDLARTRALLDAAVAREDFEEAARLRDRVRELSEEDGEDEA